MGFCEWWYKHKCRFQIFLEIFLPIFHTCISWPSKFQTKDQETVKLKCAFEASLTSKHLSVSNVCNQKTTIHTNGHSNGLHVPCIVLCYTSIMQTMRSVKQLIKAQGFVQFPSRVPLIMHQEQHLLKCYYSWSTGLSMFSNTYMYRMNSGAVDLPAVNAACSSFERSPTGTQLELLDRSAAHVGSLIRASTVTVVPWCLAS